MVFRVKLIPTRFPTNILYTLLYNKPLHSTSNCHFVFYKEFGAIHVPAQSAGKYRLVDLNLRAFKSFARACKIVQILNTVSIDLSSVCSLFHFGTFITTF